jgi:hypothetical protein
MESGMGRPAQAGDGAGIGRDFRLNKDDIEGRRFGHGLVGIILELFRYFVMDDGVDENPETVSYIGKKCQSADKQ